MLPKKILNLVLSGRKKLSHLSHVEKSKREKQILGGDGERSAELTRRRGGERNSTEIATRKEDGFIPLFKGKEGN